MSSRLMLPTPGAVLTTAFISLRDSAHELPQIGRRLPQSAFHISYRAFEGAVFYLHADGPGVACVRQSREVLAPAHVAQAGKLRCVKVVRESQNTDVVQTVPVEPGILCVHVLEPPRKLTDRRDFIHLLPDHVGRIVVETEILVRDLLKHAAPDGGTDCQVLSARPLVLGEEHGAILDADVDTPLAGVPNERGPDFLEQRPILVDALLVVAPDEGVHGR